jgi:DNA polymerase-3 subunit delta
MPKISAPEFWSKKFCDSSPRLVVLTGDDPFWRAEVVNHFKGDYSCQALGDQDTFFFGKVSFQRLDGSAISWADLASELDTPPLFGGKQIIILEGADPFVAAYTAELIRLAQNPPREATLLLLLRSLAANSRLARAVAQNHLWIDCSASAAELIQWLPAWAARRFRLRLTHEGARILVELVGENPGMLHAELAKLSDHLGPGKAVSAEVIREVCGVWRTRAIWAIIDLAIEGRLAEALQELRRLLSSGEHPLALLAQMAGSLRRLSLAATFLGSEGRKKPADVRSALAAAGIPSFAWAKTEFQLKKLGLSQAERLSQVLLEADLQLKGASSLPEAVILERLLVWLANASARERGPLGQETFMLPPT